MPKQKYNPAETEPFWPRQFIHSAIAVACTLLLLFCLAAFGMQDQDFADPISTSPVPQPDWLFMMFFQVTRYFQDGMEMVGVFWIPTGMLLGMILLLFIDRGKIRKKWLKWALVSISLIVFMGLGVVTDHTSSTTPIWSCASCHKPGFGQAFANAPRTPAEFSTRYDNKWLALHYRYPQFFWMMDADVPGW